MRSPLFRLPTLVAAVAFLSSPTLMGCSGPEKVLMNKPYYADMTQVTVVDDEELTRFNREGSKASTTPNSVVIRFYEDKKMHLFWLGQEGVMGTFEISEASDAGLKAKIAVGDDRFGEGTAAITPDGSSFELELQAPVVGWNEQKEMASLKRKIQLSFQAQAN